MPRNVRAWWIEASIDGRRQSVGLGPRGREGGGDVTFYVRGEHGEVREAFSVLCRTRGPYQRWLEVQDASGRKLHAVEVTES